MLVCRIRQQVFGNDSTLLAYCLLPIAFCRLPVAYGLLPIAYCLVPIAPCLLAFAHCLLPTACCLLPIARCLSHIAYCLSPSASEPMPPHVRGLPLGLGRGAARLPLGRAAGPQRAQHMRRGGGGMDQGPVHGICMSKGKQATGNGHWTLGDGQQAIGNGQ